jgi:DNA repair protein RadC
MYRSRKLKEIPQELRPREKLRTLGVDALSDEELMAIILGFGTKKDDVLSLQRK